MSSEEETFADINNEWNRINFKELLEKLSTNSSPKRAHSVSVLHRTKIHYLSRDVLYRLERFNFIIIISYTIVTTPLVEGKLITRANKNLKIFRVCLTRFRQSKSIDPILARCLPFNQQTMSFNVFLTGQYRVCSKRFFFSINKPESKQILHKSKK
jgi:hypothetical protein